MKKRIGVLLGAVVLAMSLCACGTANKPADAAATGNNDAAPAANSTDTAKETEKDFPDDVPEVADGVLTVGFDAEYPPYGFMDDSGDYTGFDLELAQAVCDK